MTIIVAFVSAVEILFFLVECLDKVEPLFASAIVLTAVLMVETREGMTIRAFFEKCLINSKIEARFRNICILGHPEERLLLYLLLCRLR